MRHVARQNFAALTRDEQAAAIRRLAREGMSDYGLAHATGLAVEQVRAVLAERPVDGASDAQAARQ